MALEATEKVNVLYGNINLTNLLHNYHKNMLDIERGITYQNLWVKEICTTFAQTYGCHISEPEEQTLSSDILYGLLDLSETSNIIHVDTHVHNNSYTKIIYSKYNDDTYMYMSDKNLMVLAD